MESSSIQFINSSEVIKWNLNKSYHCELSRKGIDTVPSWIAPQHLEVDLVIAKIQDFGWNEIVVKPNNSASAYLTFRLQSSSSEFLKKFYQIKSHSDIYKLKIEV